MGLRGLRQSEQKEKLADQQRQEEEEAERLALEIDDVDETVSEPSEA